MKPQNKLLLSAIALAISAQAGFATLKVPLPEFKSKADMEKSVQVAADTSRGFENNSFYTGRPFDANRQEYLFKYRNYDSELQRWKTTDPSGFPDGANNFLYTNTPTSSLDFQGLQVKMISSGNLSETQYTWTDSVGQGASRLMITGTLTSSAAKNTWVDSITLSATIDMVYGNNPSGPGLNLTASWTVTGSNGNFTVATAGGTEKKDDAEADNHLGLAPEKEITDKILSFYLKAAASHDANAGITGASLNVGPVGGSLTWGNQATGIAITLPTVTIE